MVLWTALPLVSWQDVGANDVVLILLVRRCGSREGGMTLLTTWIVRNLSTGHCSSWVGRGRY